jgi:hypothetical protein
MAPTRKELLERLSRLPPSYQKAVLEALAALDRDHKWEGFEEVPAEAFTTSRPPAAQVATSSPPPAATSLIPGADLPWPGYLWFLQNAPLSTLRDIAMFGNYWLLGHKERALIRERLGCSSEQIIFWRGETGASFSGRTARPGPGDTKESTGDSARPRSQAR